MNIFIQQLIVNSPEWQNHLQTIMTEQNISTSKQLAIIKSIQHDITCRAKITSIKRKAQKAISEISHTMA